MLKKGKVRSIGYFTINCEKVFLNKIIAGAGKVLGRPSNHLSQIVQPELRRGCSVLSDYIAFVWQQSVLCLYQTGGLFQVSTSLTQFI